MRFAHAHIGRRLLFPGRQEDRLLAPMARFSQRKALPGRLGQRFVYFRSDQPVAQADHQRTAHRSRPDVDRRRGLLQFRPQRNFQPLPLRHRDQANRATHSLQGLGRALAQRRRGGPNQSTNRTANCIFTIRAATRIAHCRFWCRRTSHHAAAAVNAADNIEEHRHEPRRGAHWRWWRAAMCSRVPVEHRRDAQSDAILECPRSRSRLVAATASDWPTYRIAAARKRFMCRPRTATALPSR